MSISEQIKNDKEINSYIIEADNCLTAIGFTEHGKAHTYVVAEHAGYLLDKLGFDVEQQELAKVSGYIHDIGNIINRRGHSLHGATMAFHLLQDKKLTPQQISIIVSAIGNHDESLGIPVNPVSAALIIADKSDVRRSRVRKRDTSKFDIHDRVNYAAYDTKLTVDSNNRDIILNIKLDLDFCSVAEYFEIFVDRMLLCIKSAKYLEANFSLIINDMKMI